MKLFSRYNRLNIIFTIGIFVIGSITFYYLLRYILVNQVDEALGTEQAEITEYVQEHNALPEILPTHTHFIFFTEAPHTIPQSTRNIHARYPGTSDDWFRQRRFSVFASGKLYTVSVSMSLEETEDLLQIIIFVTLGMVALILIAGYIINRRVLNKLWRPFYNTIEQVKSYNIDEKSTLILENTNIDEFELLNSNIKNMTERVRKDFLSLKEFTGYAAHEMQTPLAIIRTRLDMLIQGIKLSADSAQAITDIEKAVHKLSRLYQSLLLLTKVESRQFTLNEEVQLDKLVLEKYSEFITMLEVKNIHIDMRLSPVHITFHQQLSEILVGNLLSNAIHYNIRNGYIDILLQENSLVISNTSDLPGLSHEHLFQRFYRHEDVQTDGNGLGLSIVKQVCDMAGYTIIYGFENGVHNFNISF